MATAQFAVEWPKSKVRQMFRRDLVITMAGVGSSAACPVRFSRIAQPKFSFIAEDRKIQVCRPACSHSSNMIKQGNVREFESVDFLRAPKGREPATIR